MLVGRGPISPLLLRPARSVACLFIRFFLLLVYYPRGEIGWFLIINFKKMWNQTKFVNFKNSSWIQKSYDFFFKKHMTLTKFANLKNQIWKKLMNFKKVVNLNKSSWIWKKYEFGKENSWILKNIAKFEKCQFFKRHKNLSENWKNEQKASKKGQKQKPGSFRDLWLTLRLNGPAHL